MTSLIWILSAVLILATFLIALHEHKQLTERRALASSIEERRSLTNRLVLIWSSPAIAAILTLVSQLDAFHSGAEIAALKSKLAPRVITPGQKAGILSTLKPVSQDRIRVTWSPVKASEAKEYAEDIANVLVTAGFNVECIEMNVQFLDGEQGILVSYGNEPDLVENIRRIRRAFTDQGIAATYNEIEAKLLKSEGGPLMIIYVIGRGAL